MKVFKILFFILIAFFLIQVMSCKKEEEPNFTVSTQMKDIVNKIYPEEKVIPIYYPLSIKFNYPIDSTFYLEDMGIRKKFKVSHKVHLVQSSRIIDTDNVFVSSDSLVCIPRNILNNGYYELWIQVYLKVESNGNWDNATDVNGNNIHQFIKYKFSVMSGMWWYGWDVNFTDVSEKINNSIIANNPIVFQLKYNLNEVVDVRPNFKERLILDSYEIRKIGSSELLNVNLSIDNNTIMLKTDEMEIDSEYTVKLTTQWQYFDGQSWMDTSSPQNFTQNFHTLFAPNQSDQRVIYSYPCFYQYHFLKNEHSKGFIRFKRLPNDLIVNDIGTKFDLVFRFTDQQTNEQLTVNPIFYSDSLFFIYDIPSAFLDNEKLYKISLHKNESGSISPEVYSYYFRTSKFNTFLNKMSSMVHTSSNISPILTGVYRLNYLMDNNQEAFDFWEGRTKKTSGIEHNVGLVTIENRLEESSWFNVNSITQLYQYVEQYPQAITWRSLDFFGVRPRYNTAKIFTNNGGHPGYLTAELIQEGAPTITPPQQTLIYNFIALVANQDNIYINIYHSNNNLNPPYLSVFWFLDHSLEFKVKYTLPGINTTTTSIDYTFSY